MARFVNPLFGDVSRQIEAFGLNRLRAPLLEGQLRGSLAQARRANAAGALDEQTFGSRGDARSVIEGGFGDDPSGFGRAVIGAMTGGGDTRDIKQVLASLFSLPDSVMAVGQPATDNIFVGTGTQSAQNTFTGLDKVLAERAARAGRGGRVASGGSGGGGGVRSGGKLTAGGRSFLAREIKRILEDAGAEGFEGTDDLTIDALDAVTSRIANGASENDALTEVLRAIDIAQPEQPGTALGRLLGVSDPSTAGSVSLGDQLGGVLLPEPGSPGADAVSGGSDPGATTGGGDVTTGLEFSPTPERAAVVPDGPLGPSGPGLTGRLLGGLFGGGVDVSGIPPDAIEFLRQNPQLSADFDEMFGPGAAEAVLGGP